MNSDNTDVVKLLERSSTLVQSLGKIKLSNGGAIEDILSLSGISLWKLSEPTLSLHILPKIISSQNQFKFSKKLLILYLKRFKNIYHENKIFNVKQPASPLNFDDQFKNNWFFLGFSLYMYRDVLNPIYEGIKKEYPQIHPIVLNDIRNENESKGKYHSLGQFYTDEVQKESKQLKCSLVGLKKELINNGLKEAIIESGLIAWPQFNHLLDWLFIVFIPGQIPYISIAKYLLTVQKPSLILSCDVADPRSRAFCLLGKSHGIPIIELQFGLYANDSVEWKFLIADKLALWGENSKKLLQKNFNIESGRIEITGTPRFDYLWNTSDQKLPDNYFQNEMVTDSKVILFASSYTIKSYNATYSPQILHNFKERLFDIIGNSKDIYLLVKPHPLENSAAMKRMAKKYKNIIFVSPSEDIRKFIPLCKAFITLGSTSTFDAILANKLVISPNIEELVWWDDVFIKNKLSKVVDTYRELEELIRMIVQKDELSIPLPLTISDFVSTFDGKATDRVIKLCLDHQRIGKAQN